MIVIGLAIMSAMFRMTLQATFQSNFKMLTAVLSVV